MATCHDCNRPYGSGGFPDLVIPHWAWKQISPTGDDGGLLCPSCICARLEISGIRCEGAFMSGPIESVSRSTMNALRRVENEKPIETREVKEGLPGGGFHTVRRVFLKPQGARELVCPNCGNANPDKFKTVAPSNTLHGFLCMACVA